MSANPSTLTELFGEPISIYTRTQALADGELVDVTDADVTRDAGFRVPVAVTRTVWAWVKPDRMPSCQDWCGRLWDVYTMLRYTMQHGAQPSFGRYRFSVLFRGGPGLRGGQRRRVEFLAILDPDASNRGADQNMTIMLPEEE